MLISKFDLYNPEWLELVFDNRNKEYGAYDLRKRYARTMVMAMGATFVGIGLLIGAAVILQPKTIHVTMPIPDPRVVVHLANPDVLKLPPPPKRLAEPPRPPVQIKTTALPPPVVAPDIEVKTPPPDVTQIKGAIGPVTIDGPVTAPNAPPATNTTTGTGTAPGPDTKVYDLGGIDVMPAPVGGEAAWMKFLSRNLRYPQAAQEDGVSGRVYMSFIVEKDGSLSNISVERAAGHGFDEEAARVLKLAKAWKPGMQNGQAVRVKYIIPINFQFADQP